MRWVVALVFVASACGGKKDDSSEPHKPTQAELVARGAYLAALGGCAGCHSQDPERAYAGGLEVRGDFGTWRSTNITQDKATGIGAWSDDEIVHAVREGLRPDGSLLYPIMPYALYNRLTDPDVRALVAFLRTIPAVERPNQPNQLAMPKTPVPIPANEPDFADDVFKHGEYLAALMLCSHCHGDNDAGGGPLHAPNITPDRETGIGSWTEAQIASTLQTMTRPDGRVIQGPMQAMLAGWSRMTEFDRTAVAAYIHQLPAVKNQVPAASHPPASPAH